MASYDWSGEVEKIRCPTLVVVPGAETVGSVANYEPFRRLADVEFQVYDGMPHLFQAFPSIPESKVSLARLGQFIRTRTPERVEAADTGKNLKRGS